MKANLRRLGIVFSVFLNVAFLGTYLYRELPRWLRPEVSSHALPYQALQLTAEQLRAFEPLRDAFHAQLRQVGGELQGEQLRLLGLLAKPDPDLAAIHAGQARVSELQRVIQDAVIEHLLQQNRIFTPEQQVRFFQVLRERIEGADLGSPPWLGPNGGGTPICPFPAAAEHSPAHQR
ncbi:MAG: periplasmic heavy metal sensor [Deltaproteobacteria bacterium]|nr:periplasmic heavy metal sensor [Deltaproteobacteria bacterium]